MKRVVSWLIILALLFSLSACGGAAVPAASEESQPAEVAIVTAEPTEEPVAVAATPEPIPETTLADSDWVSLKATSITQDGQGGYDFTFTLKSKLDVGTSAYVDLFINGWLATGINIKISADADAEATEQFNIPTEFFALCGIDAVNEIIIQYGLYREDYADSIKDTTTIYPAGEEAAMSAPVYRYVPKESDVSLIESEDAILSVTSLTANDGNGVSLTFYFENTSDKELVLKLCDFGVNEYAFPYGYLSPQIIPGTRFTISQSIDADSLVSAGVGEVTRVDVGFALLKGENLSELISGSVPIYPSGVETPRAERTPVEGEVVLVDNEDFTIIATSCMDHPGSSRYGIGFYVENKTDKIVSIEVQNAEVNGEPCMSNSTIAELPAGMRSNVVYKWNTDAFEKAGLAKDAAVEHVTLPIYIFSDGNRKAGDEVYQHNFKIKVW